MWKTLRSRFVDVRIGVKINILLLIFTLSFVAVTLAAGSNLRVLEERQDNVSRTLAAAVAQVNAAQAAESEQRQAIQEFVVSANADPNTLTGVVRSTDAAADAALTTLLQHAALTAAAREKFQAYEAGITAWRTLRDGAIRVAEQGDARRAGRILAYEGVPADTAMLADGQQLLNQLVEEMDGNGAPTVIKSPKPSKPMLISILAGILVALGFSVLTARTISRPLAGIVDVLERVSRGDLSRRVEVTRKDEIGRMSQALNDTLTVLRDAFDEAEHRATHDSLTGLANRTLLRERMEHVQRSRHAGDDIAVLLIDLDGFKQVNDTYGHAAGDELLVGVANRLVAGVRWEDTVARIGGDEFVIVLDGVAPAEACRIAEKLLAELQVPIELPAATVRPNASIGVSVWDGECSIGDLIRESDRAMYAAKSGGRGRVVRLTSEAAAQHGQGT